MADLACTQCTVLKGFPCIQCTVHNSAWAVAMHSVHSACQILRYSVQLDSALSSASCVLWVPAHTLDGGEFETDRLYISRRDIPI